MAVRVGRRDVVTGVSGTENVNGRGLGYKSRELWKRRREGEKYALEAGDLVRLEENTIFRLVYLQKKRNKGGSEG